MGQGFALGIFVNRSPDRKSGTRETATAWENPLVMSVAIAMPFSTAVMLVPSSFLHAFATVKSFPAVICPALAQALARLVTIVPRLVAVLFGFVYFWLVVALFCNSRMVVVPVNFVGDDTQNDSASEEFHQIIIWPGLCWGRCDAG